MMLHEILAILVIGGIGIPIAIMLGKNSSDDGEREAESWIKYFRGIGK